MQFYPPPYMSGYGERSLVEGEKLYVQLNLVTIEQFEDLEHGRHAEREDHTQQRLADLKSTKSENGVIWIRALVVAEVQEVPL